MKCLSQIGRCKLRNLAFCFVHILFACLFFGLRGNAQTKNREIGTFPQTVDSTSFIYKDKMLIFPLIALSTETNWVFGVANAYIFKTSKTDPTLRTSTIPSGFLYTLNQQILVAIGANIFLPKERYIIRFENSFSKFPDKFWGIGNDTPESAKESYTFTQFYINPQVSRKIKKNLFAGFGIDFQDVFNIQYDSTGNFSKDQVVGIYNRTSYHVLGYSLVFTHDSRNHAYTPNRSTFVRIKVSNFSKNIGSDYNFQGIDLDIRNYIGLPARNVLAVQVVGQFTFGDVPYRNLAVLGGNSMMRGYYAGRYRDKTFIGAQMEHRFPIKRRFSGVTFASAGQVADQISEFGFPRFKFAAGAGLRFSVLPKENLNLRFDVAYGNNLNYYIVLSESF